MVQIDGKLLRYSGTFNCRKVVVIQGKLINIVTKKSKSTITLIDDRGTKKIMKNGRNTPLDKIFHAVT